MSGWRSNPWIPAGLSAVLLGALIVTWGQDDSSDTDDAGPPRRDDRLPSALGWERVDLGSMRATSVAPSYTTTWAVTVAGEDDGRAAVLDYSAADGIDGPFYDDDADRPGDGVGTVFGDGVFSIMTIRSVDGAQNERWWLDDGLWKSFPGPVDDGQPVDGAVPVVQGEDAYLGAVGVVATPDGPVLAGWQDVGRWQRVDDVALLVPRSPEDDETSTGILGAATEVILYGVVQDAAGVDVLAIDAYGMGRRTRWRPVRAVGDLDRVTSIGQWALDVWLAGRSGLQPVLLAVRGWPTQRAVPVRLPDVPLDADHPEVEVLSVPIGAPFTLAVQTAEGPEIWVRRHREWSRFPAPPGRIQGGVLQRRVIYLVVDGELYTGRLPKRVPSGDSSG